MSIRILCMVSLAPYPLGRQLLEAVGEVVQLPAKQELLVDRIGEFDGFLTSLAVQTSGEVLSKAHRLRVIATATTGLDHIDLSQAERQGIAVMSLRHDTEVLSRMTGTAEMAWALLLATVRRLPAAAVSASKGIWDRDAFVGRQLFGKTLGIFGFGRLGKMVAGFGRAFGMEVLACDRLSLDPSPYVEQVDFDELLQRSDVISIHVHLTEDVVGRFDGTAFRQMKRGAVLINTSRGAIVDEQALLSSLETGQLAGAGLDVINGEWRSDLYSHPLIRYAREHDNLVISPHIGGATFESQAMALEHIIRKLVGFFEKQ